MKFVLKKKKNKLFLKPKQICVLYTEKSQKEKKWKEKKWTKVHVQLKKKNRIEKFKTQNLRRGTAALVLVEDTKVTNKEEDKT